MNVGNQALNLDKILRDDDESDFLPAGGSNLAAIFGLQSKTLDGSLMKQVPKKVNTPRSSTQTISNKAEVIIAKAVYVFKLQNGSYTSIGKLGIALTGNYVTKLYQIILYKNKQEHLSLVTVTHDFLFAIQPNNYASYYDSNKENWSISFESNDVCIEFAREVGLARYLSRNGRLENVLYQNLSPANKDAIAKEGNNVSLKYFITTEIIQPLREIPTTYQTMTVEISTDDNWEKTLVGSSKGLKRILFLPPNKQISLGPGFPKEKDVLLEIEITDIQTPETTTYTHKVSSGKASIISRMAKMGQSILPKIPTSTTTDSDDTEDDISHKPPHLKRIESSEEEVHRKHSPKEFKEEVVKNSHRILRPKGDVSIANSTCKPLVNSTAYTPQWSPTQIQPNFVTLDGRVYSLESQTVTPTVPSVIDPGLNVLLSENRITNAELRMGMSKIADNVQKLLDKFHVLELQNATTPIKDRTALDATLKMLLNINASEESHKSTGTAGDNITQLNEMKDRIIVLEKELKQSKEQMKELDTQKECLMHVNESLNKTIKELEVSLKESNIALDSAKTNLEEANKVIVKYEEQLMSFQNKVSKPSEECSSTDKNDSKNKEIKQTMNKVYHVLLDKFTDESYSKDIIRTIIADTIKNVTLQVLYNMNENRDIETEPSSINSKRMDIPNNTEHTTVPFMTQNEPPPVPPNGTEDDNDWMY
ncbi:FK506-binding protein 15-like [Ceratina calcarata]|uniref:FK506-binding protein 15-like n=1 Tax=Ceratina calcarata TaxID=156304 RepID=A0AAJ7N4R4_9HYME|nr:FK506-binding protein 15-like [Ceratina calcarata]